MGSVSGIKVMPDGRLTFEFAIILLIIYISILYIANIFIMKKKHTLI